MVHTKLALLVVL